MHRLNMLRFERSWEDGSYRRGLGAMVKHSLSEPNLVGSLLCWFVSGYVIVSCSSIDLPRVTPSVIFLVPPGAFQNLHSNVIAGTLLLFFCLASSEVKLQLSNNCPFTCCLEKGCDCFFLNFWQDFCCYCTREQYLVLILYVVKNTVPESKPDELCGGNEFHGRSG